MPPQSLLRIIKRWRRYEPRGDWRFVRPITRGAYVLYLLKRGQYRVVYIGVAGLSKGQKSGIASRLRNHHKKRKNWTHYSFFEVHDNVPYDEIRELESLLLSIFRHDDRIGLENKQKSSTAFWKLRKTEAWKDIPVQTRKKAVTH
jgi:hypothetical protein